jgi:regulation of enolase protein 1 (concanavalin A-like superfamily)
MNPSRLRACLFACAFILFAVTWVARSVDAQAPLLPGFELSHHALDPFAGNVWPGDFNRDGVTDLVGAAFYADASRSGYFTAVAIGNADGTFREPIISTGTLTPWAVGDFNGDRHTDVIGIDHTQESGPPSLYILAGNGDGTLGQLHLVDAASDQPFTFAIAADFNADGRRDIIAGQQPDRVFVYAGNRDFTFAPRQLLVTGTGPADAVHGDFNGDGRRDFVVANRDSDSISLFLNDGGLLFRRSDVGLAGPATDITARDLDGDARPDFVVSSAPHGTTPGAGRVFVLRGNGDGTFNPATSYDTGRGAYQVVVGDFTHDGRTDIATANRSGALAACGGGAASFDTVSLLAARADGTFAPAIHFSLVENNEPFDVSHVNTVLSLNTSDFNGDGHQDLVASNGAVLLSRAPAPNRLPVPEADSDSARDPSHFVIGRATDPDFHALTFTWTDGAGNVVSEAGTDCVQLEVGDNLFTLTVDDGHGGRASAPANILWFIDDALQITAPNAFSNEILYADTPYTVEWLAFPDWFTSFGLYYQSEFDGPLTPVAECQDLPAASRACVWERPVAGNERQLVLLGHRPPGKPTATAFSASFQVGGAKPGTLPDNWDQGTVGDTILGAASHENGTFTVKGSGADIWGTSDEFHWANMLVQGDFEFIARVGSVENVNRWVKAGLMVRNHNLPNAAHASVFATPGRGIAFQRRRSEAATSVHTAGPALTAPVWLRLVRFGNEFTAYSRRTTSDPWTRIGSDTIPVHEIATVGLVVSSHVDGRLATATFDSVSITPPRRWVGADVSGASTVFAGSHVDSGGTVTVRNRGRDIWGTSDEFRFAYMPMSGDGSIVARVAGIENTDAWAKAAVMIRESTAPGSRHAMTLVSAAKGLALQYRPETDGTSLSASFNPSSGLRWVRLVRQGNVFISSVSSDGVTWHEVARPTITMGSNVLVGLAVTSHNASAYTTGVFDNITIVP